MFIIEAHGTRMLEKKQKKNKKKTQPLKYRVYSFTGYSRLTGSSPYVCQLLGNFKTY